MAMHARTHEVVWGSGRAVLTLILSISSTYGRPPVRLYGAGASGGGPAMQRRRVRGHMGERVGRNNAQHARSPRPLIRFCRVASEQVDRRRSSSAWPRRRRRRWSIDEEHTQRQATDHTVALGCVVMQTRAFVYHSSYLVSPHFICMHEATHQTRQQATPRATSEF